MLGTKMRTEFTFPHYRFGAAWTLVKPLLISNGIPHLINAFEKWLVTAVDPPNHLPQVSAKLRIIGHRLAKNCEQKI